MFSEVYVLQLGPTSNDDITLGNIHCLYCLRECASSYKSSLGINSLTTSGPSQSNHLWMIKSNSRKPSLHHMILWEALHIQITTVKHYFFLLCDNIKEEINLGAVVCAYSFSTWEAETRWTLESKSSRTAWKTLWDSFQSQRREKRRQEGKKWGRPHTYFPPKPQNQT